MFAWRIFAFLALAYSVQGGADLELVYKLLDCCKRAINDGVPAIPVPPHNPLVVPHNISFSGTISEVDIDVNIGNIVWYGIPDWELRVGEQLSDDADAFAVFNFDIYWKTFDMSMDYVLHYTFDSTSTYQGQVILNWAETDWIGQINFTKPGFGYTEEVNSLDLRWTVKHIDAEVTGLDPLNEITAIGISSSLFYYLNSVLGTGLSPILVNRLNNYWLSNSTRVPTLLDWCDNN